MIFRGKRYKDVYKLPTLLELFEDYYKYYKKYMVGRSNKGKALDNRCKAIIKLLSNSFVPLTLTDITRSLEGKPSKATCNIAVRLLLETEKIIRVPSLRRGMYAYCINTKKKL